VVRQIGVFRKVALGEVYPGIGVDLRYHDHHVEKLYSLAPGADPGLIRMEVSGVESLQVDGDGNLEAKTPAGIAEFSAPIAWQEIEGTRKPVSVSYAVAGREYGFRLGDYDPAYAVTIDPILQATYLGGNGFEEPLDIAVHPTTGDVYVLGTTQHPGAGFENDFPMTETGAFPTQTRQGTTLFLARLSGDLKELKQATFFDIPSKNFPTGRLLIHGGNGDVYVWSARGEYDQMPGMADAALQIPVSSKLGVIEVYFVSRFSADLTELKQSTDLLEWWNLDQPTSLQRVTFHPQTGDLYFVGEKAIAEQGWGNGDVLILRVDEELRSYVTEYTFGSSGGDVGMDIAVQPDSGDLYVTGKTTFNDFPTTTGVYQEQNHSLPALGVQPDAFVAHLSADFGEFKQATYLGGVGEDSGSQIRFAPDGKSFYLSGQTRSSDFPGLSGGAYPDGHSNSIFFEPSMYLARMSPDLKTLMQATMARYSFATYGSMFLHPLNGDIYFASEVVAQPLTQLEQFSADLTTSIGKTALIGRHFDLSPITGDFYALGREFDFKDVIPEAAGGAQPLPASKRGGLADVYVTRHGTDLASDTVPDSFSFLPKDIVAVGSVVTSDSVTIRGINSPAPIEVSGGTYSIGCTGSFVDTAGTVSNGQSVCVRHTASNQPATAETTTLSIGGVQASFTSTTSRTVCDTTPDPFSFRALNNVPLGKFILSDPVKLSGITCPTTIEVVPMDGSEAQVIVGCDGGEISPNATGGTSATVNNGQTVCIWHYVLDLPAYLTETKVVAGGVTAYFSTRSEGILMDDPEPVKFKSKIRVKRNKVVTTNAVRPRGELDEYEIGIDNGQYSIGCKLRRFTAEKGLIRRNSKGQFPLLCVRHRSSSQRQTATVTSLDIGGVVSTFASITK
jgi:hypothetical protein